MLLSLGTYARMANLRPAKHHAPCAMKRSVLSANFISCDVCKMLRMLGECLQNVNVLQL